MMTQIDRGAQTTGRAWLEVNLESIVHNFRVAQQLAPKQVVMCIVKADAYGHGAPRVAQALENAGAQFFGVATAEEALQLREAGITKPVLLLGVTGADTVARLADAAITLSVNSLQSARCYAAALGKRKASVHLQFQTGMMRLGFDAQAVSEALAVVQMPQFEVTGAFTHLAAADEQAQEPFTLQQIASFFSVKEHMERQGAFIPLWHCASSAGLIQYPQAHMDMVRPGIMLYGQNPCETKALDLKQTMALKASIAQVTKVQAGQTVGYGRAWTALKDGMLATVPVGYADGLLRGLSGKITFGIQGKAASQVGRICMDMCMVDISGSPQAKQGDVAEIFGTGAAGCLSVQEVASLVQTIPYEIFCAMGKRLPKRYIENK